MKLTVAQLLDKIDALKGLITILENRDDGVSFDASQYLEEYRDLLLNAKVDVNCQP